VSHHHNDPKLLAEWRMFQLGCLTLAAFVAWAAALHSPAPSRHQCAETGARGGQHGHDD
jgi:hypothetical protein